MIPKIKVPDESRLFFVGDLHGQYDFLQACLEELGFNENRDYLVATGDLIDRGPKSIEMLMSFPNGDQFYSVRGNHEQMFLDGYTNNDWINTLYNGGQWILNCNKGLLLSLAKKIATMPYALEFEHRGKSFGVTHAEIHPLCSWHDFSNHLESENQIIIQRAIWSIDLAKEYTKDDGQGNLHIKPIDGIDYVIHGHYIIPRPVIAGNRIYIDTGSYKNLTIAEFKTDEWKFNTYNKEDLMNG